MSTQKAITANAIKNNSGTTSIPVGQGAAQGSKVPTPSASKGTFKPVSSGIFANPMNPDQVMAMRSASMIAGIANTAILTSGADVCRMSIHAQKQTRKSIHITAWNYVTGAVTKHDNTDDFGNDVAAHPTRAIPGKLVILETGSTPVVKNYGSET